MPIALYRCPACGREQERIEITTADKAEPPPECDGQPIAKWVPDAALKLPHLPEPMQRQCGSCSFAKVTPRGTWVKFSSNKPPVPHDRHAKGI